MQCGGFSKHAKVVSMDYVGSEDRNVATACNSVIHICEISHLLSTIVSGAGKGRTIKAKTYPLLKDTE